MILRSKILKNQGCQCLLSDDEFNCSVAKAIEAHFGSTPLGAHGNDRCHFKGHQRPDVAFEVRNRRNGVVVHLKSILRKSTFLEIAFLF